MILITVSYNLDAKQIFESTCLFFHNEIGYKLSHWPLSHDIFTTSNNVTAVILALMFYNYEFDLVTSVNYKKH